MWKIFQKYPFIELMTYLEYRHTQTLLFRVSMNFRGRIKNALNYYKNAQTKLDDLRYPLKRIRLNFYPQQPDALYISKFQQQELKHHSLNRNIIVNIDLIKIESEMDLSLEKMIASNFGDVWIITLFDMQLFHQYGSVIFALLKNLFNQSQRVYYDVDFNDISNNNNHLEKRVSLDQCRALQIKYLNLSSRESIWLSVDVLRSIKELNVYFYSNASFNLGFENLDFKYPSTKFSIKLYRPNLSYLEKSVYSQIPKFFDIQCCKIIGTTFCLDDEAYTEITKIKNRFPNNTFRLEANLDSLYRSHDFDQQLKFLDQFTNIIKVEKLKIFENNEYKSQTLRNLSKFKINNTFMLYAKSSSDNPQKDKKCESPPDMSIIFDYAYVNWAQKVLRLIKGFRNYENVMTLKIKKILHRFNNLYDFKRLLHKLEEFKNISILDLPIQLYNQLAEDFIEMLNKLQKLHTLRLDCKDFGKEQSCIQVVKRISQYAIDNMKNLRTIVFTFSSPITLNKDLECHGRGSPLIITFNVNELTYFVFDPRFGTKNIIADQYQT